MKNNMNPYSRAGTVLMFLWLGCLLWAIINQI
jgi:hypothetical protein